MRRFFDGTDSRRELRGEERSTRIDCSRRSAAGSRRWRVRDAERPTDANHLGRSEYADDASSHQSPRGDATRQGTVIDTRGRPISFCEVELRIYPGGSTSSAVASQSVACAPDGTFQLSFPAGQSLRQYTGEDGTGPVIFAVDVNSIDARLPIPFIFTHQVAHDAHGNFYFPPEPDGSYAFPLKVRFDFRTRRSTEIA
ncbi:hypothetical protein AB0E69_38360 [Kribbella sp. NPDC026611]|uniref:hypothetical protein n=1 Tax=Kribbella sp. NPDC026611 TaxID=3154911 RepID=UPI0033D18A22